MMKRKAPEPWTAKLGTSALDPLEVIDLQEAIRARKKKADVQGRKFLLTYIGNTTVYYRPAGDEFVPAGYLDISRFLEDY